MGQFSQAVSKPLAIQEKRKSRENVRILWVHSLGTLQYVHTLVVYEHFVPDVQILESGAK